MAVTTPSLGAAEFTHAALRLAKEARSLCGIPIVEWPDVSSERPSKSIAAVRPTSTRWPPVLSEPPTALEFARIVSAHTPVLIEGFLKVSEVKNGDSTIDDFQRTDNLHFDLSAWQSTEYLIKLMGLRMVKVAVTPDGRADDVKELTTIEGVVRIFALPYEAEMTLKDLVKAVQAPEDGKIAYLSSQNSNLTDSEAGDLSPLLNDLRKRDGTGRDSSNPSWASEALDRQPEALNIWIGADESESSMHRDHYENIFSVVRGTKIFTVYPPTEAYFLCDGEFFPTWQYSEDMSLKPSSTPPTPWIPIDPTEHPSSSRNAMYPRFAQGLAPIRIVVEAGRTLYLPAGWFHHVAQQADREPSGEQTGLCVCINWWYDAPAAFGDRWAVGQFIREVTMRLDGTWSTADEEAGV